MLIPPRSHSNRRCLAPTFPLIVVTCPYCSYSQGNLSISSMRTPLLLAQGSGVAYLPYYGSGRCVHATCHRYSVIMVQWCMESPRLSAPCAFLRHTVGIHLPLVEIVRYYNNMVDDNSRAKECSCRFTQTEPKSVQVNSFLCSYLLPITSLSVSLISLYLYYTHV